MYIYDPKLQNTSTNVRYRDNKHLVLGIEGSLSGTITLMVVNVAKPLE